MLITQTAITPLLEIKDERFDPEKCAEYELMLEVNTERLRFMVFESGQKRVLCLEDYLMSGIGREPNQSAWLSDLVQQNRLLSNNLWKSVSVSFNTPHFTLIPDEYFRKEYIGSYLELLRGETLEHEQVVHREVRHLGARNVFAVQKSISEFMLNTYTLHKPIFLHQTHALIEGTLIQSKLEKDRSVMSLHFEDEYLTVTIAKNSRLLFCNKFAYKVASDMGYFVMFVLDSLGLRADDLSAFLYGEITPFSEDYQLLQKFLSHISFGNIPPKIMLGEAFEDLPEHRYFSLYNIYFATL